MGKLYILNCTAQIIGMHYRLDFAVDGNGNRIDGRQLQSRLQPLAPGTQALMGGNQDYFPDQIAQMIDQIELSYGAVPAHEVRTAKAKGRIRIIYSVDAQIPRQICEDVISHNMGVMKAEGALRREHLAISADHHLRDVSEQMGNDLPPNLRMELSLEDSADETVNNIEEALNVAPKGEPSRPRGRPRKAA